MTTESPGRSVRRHTPDARALTLRQHLSFVKLPVPATARGRSTRAWGSSR